MQMTRSNALHFEITRSIPSEFNHLRSQVLENSSHINRTFGEYAEEERQGQTSL
uniref:Uncharacterized protein n=1 Tax=Meloidogyne incognita TaxID=6306 RepID=A0A914KG65_MELIC